MKKNILLLFVLGLMFIPSTLSWAIAQWGGAKNDDSFVPDESYLTFISFIEGTDNIIRTEDSDGATYENDFYQDETSNFPDVDVGDQYEIYFNSITSGTQSKTGFVNTTIPNLSSRSDITLVTVSNPPAPEGLNASVFPFEVSKETEFRIEGKAVDITQLQSISTPGTNHNWIMLPFSKDYITTAKELADDIGEKFISVSKFDPTSQSHITYTHNTPLHDFPLEVGRPYCIEVSEGVDW